MSLAERVPATKNVPNAFACTSLIEKLEKKA
jgi:hypothetical protein